MARALSAAQQTRVLYREFLRVVRVFPRFVAIKMKSNVEDAFRFRAWQAKVILAAESDSQMGAESGSGGGAGHAFTHNAGIQAGWNSKARRKSPAQEEADDLFVQWYRDGTEVLGALKMISELPPEQIDLILKPRYLRFAQQTQLVKNAQLQGLSVPQDVLDRLHEHEIRQKNLDRRHCKTAPKTVISEVQKGTLGTPDPESAKVSDSDLR
ncbi:hypothetical protein FVE85_7220 [Porphyridium purpureum]|uniref:Uncharacterized protein n=1 Tax=Porphyridium purpureum TaxID=35688 RepID=A0A5J4Z8J1_PORPP|nr:hypothetical protein FVE85_7220 [Porphyridium purpureum]|eukprot:POR1344..scf295_1